MKNRSLRLAIVVMAIYSAFATFIFMKVADESTLPGAAVITVSGPTATTGGAGLPSFLTEITTSTDTAIVRESRDVHDPTTRHIYPVASGDNSAQIAWLESGYPGFSADIETVVHRASELEGMDPRGRYYIYGGTREASEVRSAFESHGYEVRVSPETSFVDIVSWFVFGTFGSLTLVTLTLVALLVGVGVVSQTKHYAVQRLHGATVSNALSRDARYALVPILVTVAITLAVAALALWRYNGLHQFDRYLALAGTVYLLVFAYALLTFSVVHHFCWKLSILGGIKGRLGFRVAAPIAYLVRVPGILLTVVILSATIASIHSLSAAIETRSDLARAGDAAVITFEGLVPPDEMDRLAVESGAWLRTEDAAGRTILVMPLELDGVSADVLMVNSTYLRNNPILTVDGDRFTESPGRTISVLVPESAASDSDGLIRELRDSGAVDDSFTNLFDTIKIKDGQETFLYDSAPDPPRRPAHLTNSIIVVADADTGYIRDDDYMALASQGRVLVVSAADAIGNVPENLMGSWISAFVPVAQKAAEDHAAQATSLRIQLASLVTAIVVLFATAVGLAQIHVRANAQTIFVRYVHGWSFHRTHRWLLVTELVLTALVLAWAATRLIDTLSVTGGEAPLRGLDQVAAQSEPWVVLGVAVLNIAVLATLVARRTQAMIRTRSEETA